MRINLTPHSLAGSFRVFDPEIIGFEFVPAPSAVEPFEDAIFGAKFPIPVPDLVHEESTIQPLSQGQVFLFHTAPLSASYIPASRP